MMRRNSNKSKVSSLSSPPARVPGSGSKIERFSDKTGSNSEERENSGGKYIKNDNENSQYDTVRANLRELFSDNTRKEDIEKMIDLTISFLGGSNLEIIDDEVLKVEIASLASYARDMKMAEFRNGTVDDDDDEYELTSLNVSSKNPLGTWSCLFQDYLPYLVIRFNTLGYGYCMLGAILYSFFEEYQVIKTEREALDYLIDVRSSVADKLEEVYSHDFDTDITTTYFDKYFKDSGLLGQEIIEGNSRFICDQKGTIRFYRSSNHLGDESLNLFMELFGVNIIIIRATNKGIYKHSSTDKVGLKYVVIVCNGNHYETVGIRYPSGTIQTLFKHDHIFVKICESLSGFRL